MRIQTLNSAGKAIFLFALLSSNLSCLVLGQAPAPLTTGSAVIDQSKPVSVPHLYWHFLIYQHHLDQLAVEDEKQGKDGGWLRSYLQSKLSMTDEEFQPIRESADRLDSAITSLNAEASADVSAYKAARSKEGSSSWSAQQYRQKLKELTGQRDAAINKEIDTLNAALSPDAAQKLQDYIKNTFSKNVSIVRVSPNQEPGRPFGPTATTGKVQP
jgi:hypothetical protein